MRRAVPSPAPKKIFGIHVIRTLLEQGCVVICAGGGGTPDHLYWHEPATPGCRLEGVEAVIDKDMASALLAIDLGADVLAIVTDVDAVYEGWGTQGSRRSAKRRPRSGAAERVRGRFDGAEAAGRVLVCRTHWGKTPQSGQSNHNAQALIRGEVGTRVVAASRVGWALMS